MEYDDTRDSSRIDSFYSALYGTYRGFDGYIDALLTYAYLDNETDRYVDFVSEKNEGNFDGYEILATVEAAKIHSLKSILIQPLLDFELGYQRQDGYTETGGSSVLRYDDQSFESYKGSLGVKTSKFFYKKTSTVSGDSCRPSGHINLATQQRISMLASLQHRDIVSLSKMPRWIGIAQI